MTMTVEYPNEASPEVPLKKNEGLSLAESDIPLKPENRRKTDQTFLCLFILCVLVLIPFVVYTLSYSQIGGPSQYDPSSGSDPLQDIYLGNDYPPLAEQMRKGSSNSIVGSITSILVLNSLIPIAICLCLALLFRYATSVAVWGILILSWSCFFIFTIFAWLYLIDSLFTNIILTCITIGLLCILIFMRSKIRLTILLFKEAAKAVYDIKSVFIVPFTTVFLSSIVILACIVSTIYMSSSGVKSVSSYGYDEYKLNAAMIFTLIFNCFMSYWILQFFFDVQYMIVSGAVTKWYFARNKDLLGNPVFTSAHVTLKYHLGTVALGSLILTLVAVIKGILLSLARNSKMKYLISCCMKYVETFLKFFTKNSYIVTAMHGTSFVQSGKQAVKLLTLNVCNTIAISYIADFVLAMSHVLVAGISVFCCYLSIALLIPDLGEWVSIACPFILVFSWMCTIVILGTFENSFSTIFLCVCQDFIINNGSDKPYAMTRNVMEFLTESKKAFAKKIEKNGLPSL